VPFFEALADKLLEYRNKQSELFDLIKKITAGKKNLVYFHFDKGDWEDRIDPFSIMCILCRCEDEKTTEFAKIFAESFVIEVPIPENFDGVPRLEQNSIFAKKGTDIDTLWKLFILALDVAKTRIFTKEFESAFTKAININGIAIAKITMGLYWVRPGVYMPLDGHSSSYIKSEYDLKLKSNPTGDEYVALLTSLRTVLNNQKPILSFPKVSCLAYKDKNKPKESADQPSPPSIPISSQNNRMDSNTIFYGPPGTGKTRATVQYAVAIIDNKTIDEIKNEEYKKVFARYRELEEEKRIKFTTFHQSFGYEEFIEGIRPQIPDGSKNDIEYEIHDGIFKAFCNESTENVENKVFIIDEINRGNISKILGELITLIEPTRRIGAEEELKITLPYSNEPFGVPKNVHIIGTMNTADRSIARIDTALRRRFSFVEILPQPEILKDIVVDGIDIEKMLEILNQRITVLLDREHTIGHSNFLDLKENNSIATLASIFENKIIPLLQEYFYDDYEKIQLILGDNQKKKDDFRFIVKKTDIGGLFGEVEDKTIPEYYYKVNSKAFGDINAYEFLKPE
jgi:hypothetical protein